MTRKKIKLIILIILPFLLTGCWDYIGLDEITVVTGIAVDKNNEEYNLTFEYVDFNGSTKSKGIVTKLIESSGTTIFDAIRNAKKRVRNKLYFSQAQSILINYEIVKKDGLNEVINFFVRDGEIRETIKIAITKEGKAKDVLKSKSVDNPSTAFEIQDIIDNDAKITGSTKRVLLYEVFNTLKNNSESLTLPLIHLTENDNKKVPESDGVVVFKKDKAIGTLNAYDSKFYLLISGSLKGGLFTIKYKSKEENMALEIAKSNTKQSYTYKNGKIKIKIENTSIVYVGEYEDQTKELTEKDLKDIQKLAEKKIKKNVEKLIDKAKKKYKYDIFSFGNLIANKDPKLWHKLYKKWNKSFEKLDVEIVSKVEIENTALFR